jgi:hypothetical protein
MSVLDNTVASRIILLSSMVNNVLRAEASSRSLPGAPSKLHQLGESLAHDGVELLLGERYFRARTEVGL